MLCKKRVSSNVFFVLFLLYALVEEEAAQPEATTQRTAKVDESFGEAKRNQTTWLRSYMSG